MAAFSAHFANVTSHSFAVCAYLTKWKERQQRLLGTNDDDFTEGQNRRKLRSRTVTGLSTEVEPKRVTSLFGYDPVFLTQRQERPPTTSRVVVAAVLN